MESNSSYNRRRVARVSVDLDRPSRFKLLKTYFNSKHLFPNVQVDVFETGKGHHIRIFQSGLNPETNIEVRRNLGDDWGRIRFDELRLQAKKVWVLKDDIWQQEEDKGLVDWLDTVFQHKFHGKWTREELCNPLAEPFYSRMPANKTRRVN